MGVDTVKVQHEWPDWFGSGTRSDYGRVSDIDFVIYGGNAARFALYVGEEASTPLKYDV